MAAPAKILAWFTHRTPPRRDPSEHVYSDMLERGVPEILEERLDSGAPEPPQRRKDDETDPAKGAPRWLLLSVIGLLAVALSAASGAWVSSVITRQSEQEQRMQAAIAKAEAKADSAEIQRVQKLETQMEQIAPAVKGLTAEVIDLRQSLAIDQANHAEQAKVSRALVKELETLNANMGRK